MGPMYHLTAANDRATALREAFRVLAAPGMVAVAASRYASALDGLARKRTLDPRFVAIRDRDLVDGQHRNDTGDINYFTTAYFIGPRICTRNWRPPDFRHHRSLALRGRRGCSPTPMRGGKTPR